MRFYLRSFCFISSCIISAAALIKPILFKSHQILSDVWGKFWERIEALKRITKPVLKQHSSGKPSVFVRAKQNIQHSLSKTIKKRSKEREKHSDINKKDVTHKKKILRAFARLTLHSTHSEIAWINHSTRFFDRFNSKRIFHFLCHGSEMERWRKKYT